MAKYECVYNWLLVQWVGEEIPRGLDLVSSWYVIHRESDITIGNVVSFWYDRTKTVPRDAIIIKIIDNKYTRTPKLQSCGENHSPAERLHVASVSGTKEKVPIGSGKVTVPASVYPAVNWSNFSKLTRKLLRNAFPRKILATHSLSGKPSPAFPQQPAKEQLDPELVNNIVTTVSVKCGVPENIVRSCITTICADEAKMANIKQKKAEKENERK